MNANGRPTADPKPHTIHIRVNQDIMDWLRIESRLTGKSITDIVRQMILDRVR